MRYEFSERGNGDESSEELGIRPENPREDTGPAKTVNPGKSKGTIESCYVTRYTIPFRQTLVPVRI